ncbi:hypothetical protein CPter291_2356 [Collimonas pratensis]|uniref:Uncharacterized protein n=1 Tax=Collimonas pratensis TaxID=279113 RepID=A0ABM5Z6Z4_9BURK|nr:hypothetical protein CPter291_2356 [Collimonas pratensis]
MELLENPGFLYLRSHAVSPLWNLSKGLIREKLLLIITS